MAQKVYTKPLVIVETIKDASPLLGSFPDSFHADAQAPARREPVF